METDWKDKQDHARRYFKAKFPKYKFLAEDFAQWYILKLLEGRDMQSDFFFRHALDFLKPIHKHYKNRMDIEYRDVLKTSPTLTAEIQTAINQLEGRERVAFTLFYKWDLSSAEIGEVLGTSHMAVSQILFKARSKIKKANKYN